MYKRKTIDTWEIQGFYEWRTGWEMVTAELLRPDALTQLRLYRENEPGTPFRLKKTREKSTPHLLSMVEMAKEDYAIRRAAKAEIAAQQDPAHGNR